MRWYRKLNGIQDSLYREVPNQATPDRVELYVCSPLEGLWVPLLVRPAEVDDVIPIEAEIELAVWDMK